MTMLDEGDLGFREAQDLGDILVLQSAEEDHLQHLEVAEEQPNLQVVKDLPHAWARTDFCIDRSSSCRAYRLAVNSREGTLSRALEVVLAPPRQGKGPGAGRSSVFGRGSDRRSSGGG